jgi:hypothetical protein
MEATRFMLSNGMSELNHGVYRDVSPYSCADGTNINNEDEFASSDEIMLEFSNASGKKRRKKKKRTGASTMRSRRDARQKARQDAKDRKLKIKEKEAETQSKTAEAINKVDPAEQKLMEELASGGTDKAPDDKKGMSKGLKIGLIVGTIVIAGVVTILVIRKMKAKKGK